MIAPTHICIKSLAIGGILILLLPMVSRSSMNDTIEMMIPTTSMIVNLCMRSHENPPKKITRGERIRSVRMIAIPAPYGTGDLCHSLG
jgi:hypothetical protein